MRKEEYGLATVAFLILSLSFPPYFIHFLAASAIGGLGYLLRSLNEKDRENLAEFEKEFRKGYELEQKGEIEKAIEVYRKLTEEYPKFRYIAQEKLKLFSSQSSENKNLK
jgi:hypothetical protein